MERKQRKHIAHTVLILMALFIAAPCATAQEKAAENKEEAEKAHQLLQQAIAADRFITRLDSLYTIDLPVGIGAKGQKEAEKYAIVISEITLEDGQAYLDAYMAFTVPGTTKKIAFKGEGIPFSFNGGTVGEATLYLVSDFEVPLSKDIALKLIGTGKEKTSVTWDCYGFKQMDLNAELLFNEATFVPENPDGTIKGGPLKTKVRTTLTNWDDLLVGLTLEPFQLKRLPGVGFSINQAVLDLSDFKNPIGIKFSGRHLSECFIEGNRDIWQGVYIQDVRVLLPPEFRKKATDEIQADSARAAEDSTYTALDSVYAGRTNFYAQNILIDELGFTGRLGASMLMRLEEGDMQGWAFSVEDFLIDIEAGQLLGGHFSGQVHVPDFGIDQTLNYSAEIGWNGTYLFTAGLTEGLDFPVFASQLELAPNSQLTIGMKENSFYPALLLNGELSIGAKVKAGDGAKAKLEVAEIGFTEMRLQPDRPYFSVKELSFGKKQNRFDKYPVSIEKAGIKNDSARLGLVLGLGVHFTGESDEGITGEGDFTIWGKKDGGKWGYDGLEIDRLLVDAPINDDLKLKGEVRFLRGDAAFGNGFRGDLDATFGKYDVGATALFGNVHGSRYWFADAKASSPEGIVSVGPVMFYSFSGGAYYRMSPKWDPYSRVAEIGKSRSGIVYVPDSTKGLKVRAATDFGIAAKRGIIDGVAEFNMLFTQSGGIGRMNFGGNAYFVSPDVKALEEDFELFTRRLGGNGAVGAEIKSNREKAQIYGEVMMEYDFLKEIFHSNFDVYINVAGGLMKGTGPGGKSGWGAIHFEENDWYVHLGTPENPNGVDMMGLSRTSSYLMAGKNVPELPLPPDNVMNSFKGQGKGCPRFTDYPALERGAGMLLGGKLDINTGKKEFLMFYGRLGCGIGFDLMLQDFDGASCKGGEGDIGINSWYAQGQGYAWAMGDIGIEVDLPFYSGKYHILDIQAAALMEAKGPNPMWLKGTVGGDYKILGGLVKGHCDFEFELGSPCELESASPFGGVPVISGTTPMDGQQEVSVFTTPQVVFNMPVDKTIAFKGEDKKMKYFRIKLDKLEVATTDGKGIAGSIKWNGEQNVLAWKPNEALPGEQQIKVLATVSFEERRNGTWYSLGGDRTETKEAAFTTGKRPPYIDPNNVQYSYPMTKAFNYYQKESTSNYTQLEYGQAYLFKPGGEWEQQLKLTPLNTGQARYTGFHYNEGTARLEYALPQDLTNNTIYRMDIVNTPTGAAPQVDENVGQQTNTVDVSSEGASASVDVTTQKAEGERTELQEKSIYAMEFRTSSYNTFEEKFNSMSKSDGISWELYPLVHSLTVNMRGERFDSYEVENLETGLAITVEPVLEQTSWYRDTMLPIIGLSPQALKEIHAGPFTLNPLTSYLFQSDGTRALAEEEIEAGTSNGATVLSGMKYYLAKYVSEYQAGLKGHVANYGRENSASREQLQRLYNSHFIPLKYGNYPVKITYTLPGEEKAKTGFIYNIEYKD